MVLLLIGLFALIVTILAALAVAAGVLAGLVAVIASPYLLVHHLHATGMVDAKPRAPGHPFHRHRLGSGRLGSLLPRGRLMKIVVVGGTGLIGSRLVARLGGQGQEAVPASPDTGVNAVTGEGLSGVLAGAGVVVDVANARDWGDDAVMDFFKASSGNLLAAEAVVGVGHHVALSVVGTDRLTESGYFRAKLAQEELIEGSSVPYSIVRATQFFEFVGGIADAATEGEVVRLPPALIQPVAADDVAGAVAGVAVGPPVNGVVEVAGPDRFRLDELIRGLLKARGDSREVVTDRHARYFGITPGERTLLPGDDAQIAGTISRTG